MKKRILVLVLALILVCSLLSVSSLAAEVVASGKHDGGPITWTLTSDGVLTISGNRSMQDKSTYEWASYADQITKVVIEDGITNIPDSAFSGYSKLQSVYIGNTVSVIKSGAFNSCSKLTSVTIPASVTEIGDAAFALCTSLKEISFESGSKLETLGGSAFQGSGLTKVTLPSSLQKIGDYAYAECASLTEALFPEGLVTIGLNAFQDCNALKTVGLPSTLEQIMSDAFLRCFNIQRLEINTSCDLSPIPYQESLTTVVFGDMVQSIPRNAFSDCVKLNDVTISDSVEVIGRNAFSGCTSLKSIVIPSGVVTIDRGAFSNTSLTSIVIPDNVTELGSSAFGSCSELETIQLSRNITIINDSTFNACTSLKEINLENITEIGFQAFEGCTSLPIVELAAVKSIGYYAFKDCTGLKSIVLPETLESVDHSIFYGCTALADVTLPEGLKGLSAEMFTNCTSLVEITIPAGVESMGGRVFSGCSKMETIYFEGDAPTFSEDSFNGLSCMVIYPADNETWTEEVQQDYGGTITWSPTHTHEYSSEVTAPTCTERGYTTYTCGVCGDVTVDDYVDALGHEEVIDEGTPATCTEAGLSDGSHCAVCESILTEQEEIPATGHTWDEGVVTKEATEEENGEILYTCETCGDTLTEELVYTPVVRLFGSGRCETAIEVANMMKETLGIDTFDAIIIASGDNFADALAGSYLAVQKKAPILLYRASAVTMNLEYILENLSDDGVVYLLGGTAAVPADVEADLTDLGITVKRLSGNTRFDTNLAILEEAGIEDKKILVCTGYNFADSLSASATGLPILLVNNGTGVLTDSQIEFLENLDGNELCIIGGSNAVSDELQALMNEYVYTDRMYGTTREWTSAVVAEYIYIRAGVTQDTAVLAYSRNYPDGLCGGPLAYMMGAPLLLVNAGAEEAAADYVSTWGIEKGVILGGTSVISEETVNAVFGTNE